MPDDFDKCVRDGGRVRTIKPKPGKFMRICFKGGKSFVGEIKVTQKPSLKKLSNRISRQFSKRR